MTPAATVWPWWLGALWLAGVVLLYRVASGRYLGISGFLVRLTRVRDEIAARRAERRAGPDLQAALCAATLDEMRVAGSQPPAALIDPDAPAATRLVRATAPPPRLPWQAPLAFVVALAAGGFLARSGQAPALEIDAAFGELCRAGWRGAVVLLIGGLLVGFGARMAGGCTSGHGLSGCGRLDRGSIAATACFFFTAVVVAWFLER